MPSIEEIAALVSVQLGRRDVRGEDRIVEDLGAESADVVNIIAAVEDKYHITLGESELSAIRTVADLYHRVHRRL